MCTFNTPFSRYRFRRMPFGISSASEVLQKRTYKAFGDIEGVHVIADDMIIAAATEEEHDLILLKVLKRAREQNIKFNPSKIQFKKSEVFYMGNVLTEHGVRPDRVKVTAIVNMPEPQSKEDVRRLIGMLNYLSPYIPNMSAVTAPVRDLLKKETQFSWLPEDERAFQTVKQILSAEPLLKLYDESKKVTIQCDASSKGLGPCLMQEGKPIAYASRSLTETEQRWFQIEKELLAIVFAAERFHQYIYGKEVEVESDHKPLETILKKSIENASPRIQLMLLRLLRYKLDVKYVLGTKLYIADALSRAYTAPEIAHSDTEIPEMELRIHGLVMSLPMSEMRLTQLKEATKEDETLCRLKATIEKGWPTHRKSAEPSIRQYWGIRDELHVAEHLIFKDERVVIPSCMRADVLKKVHETHLGIEKCKARARASMYWPGMTNDIEEMIAKCPTCAKFKPRNKKEPLMPHDVPDRPWSKIGADIFFFGGRPHLNVVDYFSKYPEVCRLQTSTASCVIEHLKPIYARHGIPDILVADNMPFASSEMRTFAAEWDFEIKPSSSEYPQSNGQSERMIGTLKQLMRKALEESKDIHLALLEYRSTPVAGLKYSPAQLLMSRMLKDKIPVTSELLAPKVAEDAYPALKARQRKQKAYYDRRTKPLSKLNVGDSVRVRLGRRDWTPAVVTQRHSAPRSYLVTTENGRVYRRNRRVINSSAEPPPVVLAAQEETPAVPNVPGSQASTPVGPTQQEGTPQQPSLPDPEVQTTPVRASTRLRRQPLWMADYVTP